jgi:hypothetical protein
MFNYYLQLGLISLKRNPILTALMVLGIALGIAASMTSLTLLHIMGGDPIPWKSDKLHYVQLDNWDPNQPYDQEGNPPDQVSYRDAQALMEAGKADKQAAVAPRTPTSSRCSSRRFSTVAAGTTRRTASTAASSCSAATRTKSCLAARTASARRCA